MDQETHHRRPATLSSLRSDVDMLTLVVQRIEKSMKNGFEEQGKQHKKLFDAIGYSGHDDHGELVGIGVRGDLARLTERVDKRFRRYDGWQRYLVGAAMASSLFVVALWWIVENKISGLLR